MQHLYSFLFRTTILIALVLSFITPPSIIAFMDFMSRDIRLFFGVICLFLLFLQVRELSISRSYLFVLLFAVFLLCIEIILAISKLSNILSYYAIIFIILLLHLVLKSSIDKRYIYVDLWVKIGYLLSYSLVVLFLLHQFTSIDTDYINLESYLSYSNRNFEYSIFGVSQPKHFGSITIARASGYWPESQFAGMYFMMNILISRVPYIRDHYPTWGRANIWAGMFTFSSAFYIVLTAYFFLNNINRIKVYHRIFLIITMTLIAGVGVYYLIDVFNALFNYTSLSDRVDRAGNAIGILSDISSITNLFFGHGVQYTGGHDKGLSIGFFHVLVERGLLGLFFVLFLSFLFLKNNKINYFVFILYLFVFTWYVNYIYWLGILALLSAIMIDMEKTNNLNKEDTLC
jgi:hypothetical protein